MVEEAVVFITQADVQRATAVLSALLGLLKTVRDVNGFKALAARKINTVKIDPEFRESARYVSNKIHAVILIFTSKFSLPVTEESVIKRGGGMVITAFNDLNDLENYYREIASTGKLPGTSFWSKFVGSRLSRFNGAERIDAPFIKVIQDVEQARTGTRPSDENVESMLRKKKIF